MHPATFYRSNSLAPAMSALLFVLLLPVLDIFTHPVSVMYGHYVPLIIRLSDLYWHTPILSAAFLGVPLLLAALLLLVQWRQFGFVRSALLVVIPFAVALLIQYFIAVQLDKYLVDFPAAGLAVPWNDVFQFPFIMWCLQLLLIYISIAAVLWLIILLLRRIVAFALTPIKPVIVK
jgi:hypothetical protein